jgi:predicted Zn-dependent protease
LPGTESAFKALLESYPNEPAVHYFYGTYLLGTNPQAALEEFRRVLALDPDNPDGNAMIAMLAIGAGYHSAAQPYAEKAAAKGPAVPMAQYAYGVVLAHAGDARAVAYLEAAAKLDPVNFEYHMALASAYSKFGRPADAHRERLASIALAKETDAAHAR